MKKSDIAAKVAENHGLSKKQSAEIVDDVFSIITKAMENGEKVEIYGFGNFEVRERAAREGRNPQTGKPMQIAATKVPAFKPLKALKEACK